MPVVRPFTAIAGVLVVLALLLAPYVRSWLEQRSQIAAGQQQVQQLQREVSALQLSRQRWNDPTFVKAQARQRLHFVMPGEVGYVLLDDAPPPAAPADPRSAAATMPAAGTTKQPWYASLWQSIELAGDPATEQSRSAPRP